MIVKTYKTVLNEFYDTYESFKKPVYPVIYSRKLIVFEFLYQFTDLSCCEQEWG